MGAVLKIPDEETAEEARTALRVLSSLPNRKKSRQIELRAEGKGGPVSITVPREAFDLFLDVLGQMSLGNAVTIVPVHAELTTQQAADLLNVSRPFLIQALEDGRLPYRKVGTHRRIRAEDLFELKRLEEARRRAMLDELTAEAEKLGLGY
jgi:excisionase family DNA binding protein